MQKVAIVIPTYNRRDYLRDVLSDLSKQSMLGVVLHVVVVVDGSSDGTHEMLASEFPDVESVTGDGSWYYTRSMNEGFQRAHASSAEFILTLNDDIRLEENYVQKLVNAMNSQQGITVMGSVSVTESSPHKLTFSGIKDIKWWRFKYVSHLPNNIEVNPSELSGIKSSKVLPGRGMMIPAKLLKDLRGFDPKLPQYGSDDDFCLRAAKKGAQIKVSYDAVVYSYEQLTGLGNPAKKEGLSATLKGFRNKYSTLYIPKTMEMIRRHGVKALMPLTVFITIIASMRANMKFRKA